MGFVISDELLAIFLPIVLYWVCSGIYVLLGSFENYRLHSKMDEDRKNLVSKRAVIKRVLFNQTIQAVVVSLLFKVTGSDSGDVASPKPSLMVLARQFVTAMLVFDTWQYFTHRYFHQNEFLYKHFHSQHHRLIVPYAFGAIYHHPFEGLISDVIGSALTVPLSGMSPRTSIIFFSFATIKTVDDHCGLWLPRWNPFHIFFRNNSAYHDAHHQLYGSKYNFSTMFFVHWDKILGTCMPYSLDERAGGGFEARTVGDSKNN